MGSENIYIYFIFSFFKNSNSISFLLLKKVNSHLKHTQTHWKALLLRRMASSSLPPPPPPPPRILALVEKRKKFFSELRTSLSFYLCKHFIFLHFSYVEEKKKKRGLNSYCCAVNRLFLTLSPPCFQPVQSIQRPPRPTG